MDCSFYSPSYHDPTCMIKAPKPGKLKSAIEALRCAYHAFYAVGHPLGHIVVHMFNAGVNVRGRGGKMTP